MKRIKDILRDWVDRSSKKQWATSCLVLGAGLTVAVLGALFIVHLNTLVLRELAEERRQSAQAWTENTDFDTPDISIVEEALRQFEDVGCDTSFFEGLDWMRLGQIAFASDFSLGGEMSIAVRKDPQAMPGAYLYSSPIYLDHPQISNSIIRIFLEGWIIHLDFPSEMEEAVLEQFSCLVEKASNHATQLDITPLHR